MQLQQAGTSIDRNRVAFLHKAEGAPWPDLVQVPGVRAEALPLEDLFIEVSA